MYELLYWFMLFLSMYFERIFSNVILRVMFRQYQCVRSNSVCYRLLYPNVFASPRLEITHFLKIYVLDQFYAPFYWNPVSYVRGLFCFVSQKRTYFHYWQKLEQIDSFFLLRGFSSCRTFVV